MRDSTFGFSRKTTHVGGWREGLVIGGALWKFLSSHCQDLFLNLIWTFQKQKSIKENPKFYETHTTICENPLRYWTGSKVVQLSADIWRSIKREAPSLGWSLQISRPHPGANGPGVITVLKRGKLPSIWVTVWGIFPQKKRNLLNHHTLWLVSRN